MLKLYACLFFFTLLLSEILGNQPHEFNLLFQQNDYKMKVEWGEVARYDKRYIRQYDGIVFKYNRSLAVGNLTFVYNIDTGHELEIIIQAYKFASNEYRLFPMRMEVNLCVAMAKNLVGIRRTMTCRNFTGCPFIKRRRYHICNWTPDPTQFPPFIPSGRYKIEVQGMYHDQELWVVNAYGRVYRALERK